MAVFSWGGPGERGLREGQKQLNLQPDPTVLAFWYLSKQMLKRQAGFLSMALRKVETCQKQCFLLILSMAQNLLWSGCTLGRPALHHSTMAKRQMKSDLFS